MHSGLQYGGDPINPLTHEQDGDPELSLHTEFGPHGEGVQGFTGSGVKS